MGKTIRRKTDKRPEGAWDYHSGRVKSKRFADAYFHSDMPYRHGRAAAPGSGVKAEANMHRRCELRILKGRVAKDNPEDVLAFSNDDFSKKKANAAWEWS